MQRDSTQQTIFVAASLCLICSVLVSSAAVVLRPQQVANREEDMQKNILQVAGRFDESRSVGTQFSAVETLIVNLDTGVVLSTEDAKLEGIDSKTYDPRKTVLKSEISPAGALPQITSREVFARVYLLRNEDGSLDQAILPIYGKGLWSTLYGFLALDSDTTTIRGITFYQHGETPGLGGEVDNPTWKASWSGKLAFDGTSPEPVIEVIKGAVDASRPEAAHQVDGLSGATITTKGVSDLVRFWLSPGGYGKFLESLRHNDGGNAEASGDAAVESSPANES